MSQDQPAKPYPEDWPQPKPYIGVTGFNSVHQVQRIAEHVNGYPLGYIMFGITSSNKRLLDPESRGKTSPALVDIPSLRQFIPEHHLPMIHYYTSNMSTLVEEVVALWSYCELENVGLQLNVDASPKQIAAILEALNFTCSPNFNNGVLPITLQVSRKTLATMSNADIIKALRRYEGLLSYALIDPSGGEGRDIALHRASELLVAGQDLEFLLGIAGGFSDENVEERVKKLRKSTVCESCHQDLPRSFCIDAQGKLADIKTTAPIYPPDGPPIKKSHLNVPRTKVYIDRAISALYS